MAIVEQAMVSAMSCPKEHDLQETGTIVKEETNLLGLPLVILDMDVPEGKQSKDH